MKYGKFYADWRDADGVRKAKAFCTIEEAVAWKEANRRKTGKRHKKYATEEERHAAKLRKHYRWRHRETLRNPLRGLFRKLGVTEYDCKKNGMTTIGVRNLVAPRWFVVDRRGKRIEEKLETPERMAERLGLAHPQQELGDVGIIDDDRVQSAKKRWTLQATLSCWKRMREGAVLRLSCELRSWAA